MRQRQLRRARRVLRSQARAADVVAGEADRPGGDGDEIPQPGAAQAGLERRLAGEKLCSSCVIQAENSCARQTSFKRVRE